jgi:hypothetical protein
MPLRNPGRSRAYCSSDISCVAASFCIYMP